MTRREQDVNSVNSRQKKQTVIDIYFHNRVVTSSGQWMALLLDREKEYYPFNYHHSFSWEKNCSRAKLENRLCVCKTIKIRL